MATGRVPTTANSPLTAKGDLFGYSTTQARVPVGSDGETLVADSSATTGLRWQGNFAAGKNKIINGDFNINQRGFTSTTTNGTYTFDRFLTANSGGTSTFSAQTFTPGSAPVSGYESTNFISVASTGQSAASDFTQYSQRIEDVRTLAGQTVTVSFWAKASSGTPKVAVDLQQFFGTGGSANVNNYAGEITTSTSWARYSLTTTLASISGKTITGSSLLRLGLWTSAGSDFTSRGINIGIQTATISFWGIQVEAGNVATAFQTATGTLAGELAAARRYFRLGGSGAFGQAYSTTNISYMFQFDTQMRTTPTVTANGQGDVVRFGTGISTSTTWTPGSVYGTANGVGVDITTNAIGYASGDRVGLSTNSLFFSAEL